jgi:two-component system chemotaxis response regulator CheB
MKYRAVVMGTSSGGLNALKVILPALPANFGMPVILVQHIGASSESYWIEMLDNQCKLKVKEADEKEEVTPGTVYIAPPNYHLMVERDETLSLSIDARVNFARPSIDVLFESAAPVYRESLVGIVLTGANHDGAGGLLAIKKAGGLTVAQDPATAESQFMPATAISTAAPHHVLSLTGIVDLLIKISQI